METMQKYAFIEDILLETMHHFFSKNIHKNIIYESRHISILHLGMNTIHNITKSHIIHWMKL